ncbi:MAG: prenyltransferase/squalene oxidase repeat-containing protein [Candidatus Hodarchaeota archaeon]
MKKSRTFILLVILMVGIFPVAIPTVSLNRRILTTSETSDSSQGIEVPPVATKITQEDPPGYLTGKIMYNGLNDVEPDGYYDTLMIDVEITTTEILDYAVMAKLYDRSFQRRYYFPSDNRWNFDSGYRLWGNSSFQTLASGTHYVTVHFNCTQLRALKLGGPYFITHVQLVNGTAYNYDIIDEEWTENDDDNPLFVIPQIFDIYSFNEPMETGYIVLHDEILTTERLEVNVTFQSFSHWWGNNEDYYIRLVLRDLAGSTIGHWEQAYSQIPSNQLIDVTMKIPSEFLGAFDFGGASYPTLWFEEVTIVQLHHRGPFDTCNMSYKGAYSTSSIYVTPITPINTFESGQTFDFGNLEATEIRAFRIISQNPDDILDLEVDRIMPMDTDPPRFQVWYLDGWGRCRGFWHRDPYISWEEWWDNIQTMHYKMHIGRHPGPWFFHVMYPDEGQPLQPPQGLTVRTDITGDVSPPFQSFTSPSETFHYKQFYGIPIKGTKIDESAVILYQIIKDGEILLNYRPFEMYWGEPPLDDAFSFVWFPSDDLLGTFNIAIRAYDMTYRFAERSFSLTIDSGTKPSPESTINKGLNWLQKQQNNDGSWEYQPGEDWGNSGMAALAALCFIQAGLSDQQVVKDAVNYLRDHFQYNSEVPGKHPQSIYMNTYMTSMAATTLIAYNATLPSYDSSLSSLIDDAIEWLVETQNDETWGVYSSEPWYGGWRYGDQHDSSDLSVSQWAILALATYDNFNPDQIAKYDPYLWDKVDMFVKRCRGGYDQEGIWMYDGGFTYTPSTEDWRDWGGSSYGSMTAAGIWGLYLSGSEPNDPDIISALDWINNSSQIVGGNPYQGRSFEYYWYLSASKAFLMAGRESDQWWYDAITDYLNTHMIYDGDPLAAYWDNTMGGEPPVYATVLAILSQQVFYGHIPMHTLEVSLEADDGSAIYLWNSSIFVGYNFTTGFEVASAGTSYLGLLEDIQTVSIVSPSKGEYFIDIFPAVGASGMSSPQNMILRGRALTESGHIISYKTEFIDYQYSGNYPQILRYKMVLSTISGLDIHFLFDGYETFTHSVNFNSINYPTYVDLNEEFDITVALTKIGVGTIPTGTVFSMAEDFPKDSEMFTNWDENVQKSFTFHYDPSGFPAGIRTIVIGLMAEDTTPLLIRVKVQVGNRAPEGKLDALDAVLSGTETISWTASDLDGDDLSYNVYLVLPDGSKDSLALGITKTSYYFDTTAYPDDTSYRIIVEISDGTDTTELKSSLFAIQNEEETTETGEGPQIGAPGFELLFSLIALSFILTHIRRRK